MSTDPVLDPQAGAAYRERILELEADVEEADASHDLGRAARAKEELDFLVSELAVSYGLGGRERRVPDAVERARKAVGWRIRDSLGKIAKQHPTLGRHLRDSISTGTFCCYRPAGPVRWAR